jgi:hypothetical protein
MRKRFLSALILICSVFISANACDFNFSVDGNKKNCRPGEVIVLNVELTLIHRTCNVAPMQTKFKIDGVKVQSASNWKPVGGTKFERTIKLLVLNDGKKKVSVTAFRTCDKEGGTGTFSMPKL